jgi:RNA-dependent RNA polymerase
LGSDIFYVTKEADLFPTVNADAAKYEGADPFTLPDGRTATIEDVCDFVVNYIGSDVLVSGDCFVMEWL